MSNEVEDNSTTVIANAPRQTVQRAEGVTTAERRLKRLCEKSFLRLWSHAGVYRDQGKTTALSDGKELCDLLIVFENHVIIFSDKDCAFPDTGDLQLDWSRWFRKAILKSANQLWGAERWIIGNPDRLYLDRTCTRPFPIPFPELKDVMIHRIVVAHGATDRCRRHYGGSGSLMIDTDPTPDGNRIPFVVGQLDPAMGFVHVLDDTSLDILMGTLNTVTDFVDYLVKKERFLASRKRVIATGEEELLAYYLGHTGKDHKHCFPVDARPDCIGIVEGHWKEFEQSPQRKAQLKADEISYSWDAMVETFVGHILRGTQHYTSHGTIKDSEKIVRFFAREPRFRRRILAEAIHDILAKTPPNMRATRVMVPTQPGEPHYVFLLVPRLASVPYDEYRDVRLRFLEACCHVTKLIFPDAKDIVGLATETGRTAEGSEDALYYDTSEWSEEDDVEARRLQTNLGILVDTRRFEGTSYEFPIDAPEYNEIKLPGSARNKPCPCGSGRKYKHCHYGA